MIDDASARVRGTEDGRPAADDGARIDDATLLRRYAEEKSEDAFAELVRRHLDLVYAVALRKVGGDAHLAKDMAQQVFASLATKASALRRHPTLAGWLFTSTHYAASQLVRAERRRRLREQKAQTMNELLQESGPAVDWEALRPVLDDLICELGERDREAVVLRFFEGRSLAQVGKRLQLSEEGARSRVERALDKLRMALGQRGVTSTSTALGLALASHVSTAAPAGLAATVTSAALAGSGTAAAWATLMTITKLQIGIGAAVVVAGTVGWVAQADALARRRAEVTSLRAQNQASAAWRAGNVRLAPPGVDAEAARTQAAELERLRGDATTLRERLRVLATARGPSPEARPKGDAPFTGMFYEPSQVDAQPKPTFQARPMYPAELRQLGITGQATVDFIVDAKGGVRSATLVEATHPALGESALAAVREWEFEPAQKEGQAVATHLRMPIVFTLASETKAATKQAGASNGKKPSSVSVPWF